MEPTKHVLPRQTVLEHQTFPEPEILSADESYADTFSRDSASGNRFGGISGSA
jgi:hypothetical protein